MSKSWLLCTLALFLWCVAPVPRAEAQELLLDELPALRDKALVLQITTKVAEKSRQEVWSAFNSKITIPGRPVEIKLVGENLIIAIKFTPYQQRRGGKYDLVAQSQIWINIPDKGMSYKTNNHSIPLDFGEPILYFPLGSSSDPETPLIELHLTMYRYGEEPEAGTPPKSTTPDEKKPAALGEPAPTDRPSRTSSESREARQNR